MEFFEIVWIFLIIYILYRILFAPRQRQRQQMPPETYEEESAPTKARDEILEELRTVFEEEPTSQKPTPKSPQTQQYRQPPDIGGKKPTHDSYANYTGTEFVDTTSSLLKEADEISLISPGLAEEKRRMQDAFTFLYDFDELKKGIIISEVLGKPKSRRYNTFDFRR